MFSIDLAETLAVPRSELFVAPPRGSSPPKPLRMVDDRPIRRPTKFAGLEVPVRRFSPYGTTPLMLRSRLELLGFKFVQLVVIDERSRFVSLDIARSFLYDLRASPFDCRLTTIGKTSTCMEPCARSSNRFS